MLAFILNCSFIRLAFAYFCFKVSVDMSDYYSILGIDKGASEAEVKKAYRKKAQEFHPDKNPGDKGAEAKFKEVQEAYEVLSDSQKRSRYDQFGTTGAQFGQGFGGGGFDPNGFNGFADIFESFFGGGFEGGGFGGTRESSKKGAGAWKRY